MNELQKPTRYTRNQVEEEIRSWDWDLGQEWPTMVASAYSNGYLFNPKSAWRIRHYQGGLDIGFLGLRSHFIQHNDIFSGPFAWVTYGGIVVPCGMAGHDAVAETLLGLEVGFVERRCARITASCRTLLEPMRYVDPEFVTPAMQLAVIEHMGTNRGGYWPDCERAYKQRG